MILRRKKYHYNSATLTFEEIKRNKKGALKRMILIPLGFIVLSFLSGFILNHVFESPKSMMLQSKVNALNLQLDGLIKKGHHFSNFLNHDHSRRDNNFRAILQLDTLPYSFREAGTGGSAADPLLVMNDKLSNELNSLITKLNSQLRIQTSATEQEYVAAKRRSRELTHMPAIQPIAPKDLVMISSGFGVRTDPFLEQQEVHTGLDFVASTGTPVYATGDGIVTLTEFSRTGYGNEILIDHAFGFGSRYAHLSQILVKEGQKVKRGELIGKVGETGRATGPHLHYEVLYEHKPVNPAFYYDNSLTPTEYQQILNMALNNTN